MGQQGGGRAARAQGDGWRGAKGRSRPWEVAARVACSNALRAALPRPPAQQRAPTHPSAHAYAHDNAHAPLRCSADEVLMQRFREAMRLTGAEFSEALQ